MAGGVGSATNSPGVVTGNAIQIPIQVPLDLCGNTVSIVGMFSPTAGNTCLDRSEVRAGSTLSIPTGASAESTESANTRRVDVVLAINASGQVIGAALPLNTPGFDLTEVRHWQTSEATLFLPPIEEGMTLPPFFQGVDIDWEYPRQALTMRIVAGEGQLTVGEEKKPISELQFTLTGDPAEKLWERLSKSSAINSPGVVSGNTIQIPIQVPSLQSEGDITEDIPTKRLSIVIDYPHFAVGDQIQVFLNGEVLTMQIAADEGQLTLGEEKKPSSELQFTLTGDAAEKLWEHLRPSPTNASIEDGNDLPVTPL